jgi:hypothetical protein
MAALTWGEAPVCVRRVAPRSVLMALAPVPEVLAPPLVAPASAPEILAPVHLAPAPTKVEALAHVPLNPVHVPIGTPAPALKNSPVPATRVTA